MQLIEKYVYTFDKDNPPTAHAVPGEILQFCTLDCFSNRIQSASVRMCDLDYSYDGCNPASGPVYIEGAEPGDVLVVDILDIEVADYGVIATDTVCGPLYPHAVDRSMIIPIRDGYAQFHQVRFPIRPMIGVIGTAPAGEKVIDGFPGSHGGNLDSKLHTKGSRIYLPVRVPGALLQMGDVHAAMGDGELCGTGIEIPALITVRVGLRKQFVLHWPVTETETHWYVNACAAEFPEALRLVSEEAMRLLMNATGWDETDTYMYLSVQCDVGVDQACVPCSVPMILRMGIPKNEGMRALIP